MPKGLKGRYFGMKIFSTYKNPAYVNIGFFFFPILDHI